MPMIIITGGSGFIGSNLVAGLEKHTDDDLVICDITRPVYYPHASFVQLFVDSIGDER